MGQRRPGYRSDASRTSAAAFAAASAAAGWTPWQPVAPGVPVLKYVAKCGAQSGVNGTEPWMSSSTVNTVPPMVDRISGVHGYGVTCSYRCPDSTSDPLAGRSVNGRFGTGQPAHGWVG